MNKQFWAVAIGLAATAAVVVYMVVRLGAQDSTLNGDFSNAATAEVRDGQGQVVLSGQFNPVDEDDEDIERKAALQPTGLDPDASGEAEVEVSKARPANQEIEFSVRHVEPGTAFTFVIDGQEVATAAADQRGRVDVELDVSASR